MKTNLRSTNVNATRLTPSPNGKEHPDEEDTASAATRERLQQLFDGQSEVDDVKGTLVREAVRLIVEEALEGEVADALGRGLGRYQQLTTLLGSRGRDELFRGIRLQSSRPVFRWLLRPIYQKYLDTGDSFLLLPCNRFHLCFSFTQ